MSYHIIYDKQFVRLTDGRVIPMMLSGDNNVTEMTNGRERRTRDWHFLGSCYAPEFASPSEELMRTVQSDIDRVVARNLEDRSSGGYVDYSQPPTKDDVLNHYGWYVGLSYRNQGTGKLTATQYAGIWSTGIKNALTIEELNGLGINLEFSAYVGYREEVSEKPPYTGYIRTETQFYEHLEIWRTWTAAVGWKLSSITLGFGGPADFVTEKLLSHRQSQRKRKPKVPVPQDHYFVLENDEGMLVRYLPRGFSFSRGVSHQVKKFETEAKAEQYRAMIVRNGRHRADTWRVKRIEQVTVFQKAA